MSPTHKRRGRPKKFDEAAVLDVITDVFWTHGYTGTSLDLLSSAAGVARPSLYATFGDKEAMYLSAIQHFFGRMERAIAPVAAGEGPPGEVLTAIFDTLIDLFTTGDEARGCLVLCTAPTEAAANERIRDALVAMVDHVGAWFEQILEGAKARGHLAADVDVKACGALLGSVTHTLAIRARAQQRPARLREIAAHAIALVTGPR